MGRLVQTSWVTFNHLYHIHHFGSGRNMTIWWLQDFSPTYYKIHPHIGSGTSRAKSCQNATWGPCPGPVDSLSIIYTTFTTLEVVTLGWLQKITHILEVALPVQKSVKTPYEYLSPDQLSHFQWLIPHSPLWKWSQYDHMVAAGFFTHILQNSPTY